MVIHKNWNVNVMSLSQYNLLSHLLSSCEFLPHLWSFSPSPRPLPQSKTVKDDNFFESFPKVKKFYPWIFSPTKNYLSKNVPVHSCKCLIFENLNFYRSIFKTPAFLHLEYPGFQRSQKNWQLDLWFHDNKAKFRHQVLSLALVICQSFLDNWNANTSITWTTDSLHLRQSRKR